MDNLFNNIYQGKRVLITGHTGFKGSWLSLWLSKLGAEILGYSIDIPTEPNHFELLKLKMNSIMADILNAEKLLDAVENFQPDIIFHLAAQPLVRASYREPVKTFATNIMGTVNVLESCRQAEKVKAVINVTSDKCYRNNEWDRGYTEEDALGGNDPYSASKGGAELVGNAYRHSFFNPKEYGVSHTTLLADVRAGNVIGGGDWAEDRLIPDLMKAAGKGKGVEIRNPQSTRPWQHVLESLSGYLQLGWKLLVGKKEFAENWNFGPDLNSELKVIDVIEKAKHLWPEIKFEIKQRPNDLPEAKLLKLDSSKARGKLKWQDVWTQSQALEKTINWYKNYYQNGEVLSEKDLLAYIEAAKAAALEWAKV
ncbi:CDP-glucose 4,6-dehydratase [Candidatus Parcubacteria bacterium]|jgi:CDP-glucose 4,6-dehydratase|nr:MAG: CDP-glucose 4,6-dehydratase [Candidatus Parcubacteria bacterium]